MKLSTFNKENLTIKKVSSVVIFFIMTVMLLGVYVSQVRHNTGRDALGDVNNDGMINVVDIVRLVDIVLGAPSNEYEQWAGDVNSDETINIGDIVIIVSVILETFEYDCSEDYSPCPNNFTQCCLDTTTHNFTFFADTLTVGEIMGVLFDVSIISEDNVWAVGEFIYNGTRYNAVRWNGSEWEYMRIAVPPYNNIPTFRSIIIFDENDIWLGVNMPVYWNGTVWQGAYYMNQGWEDGCGISPGLFKPCGEPHLPIYILSVRTGK